MDGLGSSVLFVGDLSDPWVAELAGAIPGERTRLAAIGEELPKAWPELAGRDASLILHRPIPSRRDLERLRRLREGPAGPTLVVLCYGSHARYHQIEPWVPHVEATLPEATAAEVIGCHLDPGWFGRRLAPAEPIPVTVVSQNYELCLSLADISHRSGFPTRFARDWSEVSTGGLAVWDVPILDPTWENQLQEAARNHTVITLIGFADRETVTLARSLGAAACLDLPCGPEELVFALDRLAGRKGLCRSGVFDPPHPFPPAPRARDDPRRQRRMVVRRQGPYNP